MPRFCLVKLKNRLILIFSLILILFSHPAFSKTIFFNSNNTSNIAVTQTTYKFTPFKMIFIPDTHLAFNLKDNSILYNESLVILQDVIKSVNKIDNLDFVIFGGDLVENKDKQLNDLSVFQDTIADLKSPYYVIFGDRDADLAQDYTKQDFCTDFRRNGFQDKDKTYWTFEPVANVVVIGLDTTIKNSSSGEIPQEELTWLEDTLKNNKDKFTVILMHHPIDSPEFSGLLAKFPQVKLVLSGHELKDSMQNINNAYFISAPSIVAYPNKFKILTIYPDKTDIQDKAIGYKQLIKKAKKAMRN